MTLNSNMPVMISNIIFHLLPWVVIVVFAFVYASKKMSADSILILIGSLIVVVQAIYFSVLQNVLMRLFDLSYSSLLTRIVSGMGRLGFIAFAVGVILLLNRQANQQR